MQGGILDIVVGFLVFFSNTNEVNYLNLLIVGYMLTQGIYRNVLSLSQSAVQQNYRVDFDYTRDNDQD